MVQPKRRPIRGSASCAKAVAKAAAPPGDALRRESDRLAVKRTRIETAQHAIAVWVDLDHPGEDAEQKATRVYTELEGVFQTLLLPNANTVDECLWP